MNAIIAAATGYTERDLRFFLRSAERYCGDFRMFLIVYREQRRCVEKLRQKYRYIEPVYIMRRRGTRIKMHTLIAPILSKISFSKVTGWMEFIGRYPLNISLERYFIALKLVEACGGSFSKVLLTDSRDVLFQADPFAASADKLFSGLEDKTIGECKYNSEWIRTIYGENALREMVDWRMICSGVTLGSTQSVKNYLIGMCGEIWKHLPRIFRRAALDQGIHNRLIFENKIAIQLTENSDGLIATIGTESPKNLAIDAQKGFIQVHGKFPAIVHQFDRRFLGLMDFLEGMFPFEE